ncbi:unnamed protein product [Owenia fusiformis]|uniref:Uncharacterized protein n=1 Tax=Owenia fusiformis TaxID=6347 RepID=A0A8J1Y6C5_OWEFU|nr:unnamed protein product [Owenia fusiformis]
MDRWSGRVALVTGASSGIGAAIAEDLVKAGVKVIGCARRVELIQALAEKLKGERGMLNAIKCDLYNEDEIKAMFEAINKDHGGVDICINNAGMGNYAPLLDSETTKWKQMINLNILALCICTREAIKGMRARGMDNGHVIHIASMDAHRIYPEPGEHFLAATKQMVRALLEGHRNELRALHSHIRVSEVCPAMTETPFTLQGGPVDEQSSQYKFLEARDVSASVMYILSQPPHVQVHDVLLRPTEQVS